MEEKRVSLEKIYRKNCFDDSVMKQRLPSSIYRELQIIKRGKKELTLEVAEVVASSMKDWAIERGATHFTHWFQPLTGLTAEKHDSFLSPSEGSALMEFSGKSLVKGEPDASSFPSGGLRTTFEARGYTAWDTSSPAFLKESGDSFILAIPSVFVSYRGEALDKKVPLLRTLEAANREIVRLLRACGDSTTESIEVTVGIEQEYFLVDKKYYKERPDLLLTGRTVQGSLSLKGQKLENNYFGSIKKRVATFMDELNRELWQLGISAKTQHNEVAPGQYELALVYSDATIVSDWNQLVMESLQRIAQKYEMVALLHEKPFDGINGSGKHNNWSIATDRGVNLFNPGEEPQNNTLFLLLFSAFIKAVDEYAPLLSASIAGAGNDHRLGGNEAPPAIISLFIGEPLTNIFEQISRGEERESASESTISIGSKTLPKVVKDISDRNRTSPIAFTGDKFEFRMVGSSQAVAWPNTVLTLAFTEIVSQFAQRVEKSSNREEELLSLIRESYKKHKRVIFNGNGYSKEWIREAEERGLYSITSTPKTIAEIRSEKSLSLFEKQSVLSQRELESRASIYLDTYSKQVELEANVLIEMAERGVYPTVIEFMGELSLTIKNIAAVNRELDLSLHKRKLALFNTLLSQLTEQVDSLKSGSESLLKSEDTLKKALFIESNITPLMKEVRTLCDSLESMVSKSKWPYPGYEEMLFDL